MIDAKTIANNGFKGICKMFLQDLHALPEDSFDKCFGGKARTIADIVYEVNMVNDHIGLGLRGEEQFVWPEGWVTAPEDFRTKDVVIEGFEKSSQRMFDTIDAFTPEQFEGITMNEGKETTPFERVRFMTVHLWYHCGQLNFIQTLLGDDGWNWK